MLKARLRNGKIVTGRAADVFLKIGIAEEIRGKRVADEKSAPAPKPTPKRKPRRKTTKKRGRPAKK